MFDYYDKLFTRLYTVKLKYSIINTYNIFSVLSMERDETKLHSAIIADLLNPNGMHELGSVPLILFLKNALSKLNIPIDDIDSYKVETEFDLGRKNIEIIKPTGGRLDILLESNTTIIAIENKIFASDQEYQLTRYANSLEKLFPKKNRYLIYLNPKGKLPSKISIYRDKEKSSLLKNSFDYHVISYRNEVLNWLRLIESTNDTFRSVISQYIDVIMKMIRRFEMLDTINDSIVENNIFNFDSFNSLCFIADNIKSIESKFINSFINSIEEEVRCEYSFISKDRNEINSKHIIIEYIINENKVIYKYLYASHELFFGVKGNTIKLSGFDYMQKNNKSDFSQRRKITIDNKSPICDVRKEVIEQFKYIIKSYKET